MLPISLLSCWMMSPPFRRIAPATPPPCCRSLLAALTIASVSISVKSPCTMTIREAMGEPRGAFLTIRQCFLVAGRVVFVYSPPRFPPQPPGLHVLRAQRPRPVHFAERLVKIFQNTQPHVEPHQVRKLEGSHGVIQPKLQGLVDVCRARDPCLQHVKRLIPDH